MSSNIRSILIHPALLCALALALCVAASHPVLEMGLDDDWSYIWSARVLAETGHMTYNGWGAMILGWQMYLGALFAKLFGFSFTIVRLPILFIAMGTAALLHRLFVRLGITEWNATIATLTIVLSPDFMPLAYSFMSDISGFFCIVLCLYMCVRAVQAETDSGTLVWLVLAALGNALGGTVRQIAWLGVLVIVPSTTLYLRRRRGALVAGAISCMVGVGIMLGCMHWFSLQPYSIVEKTVNIPTLSYVRIARMEHIEMALPACCMFLLPVLAAFVWKYPFRLPQARIELFIVEAALLAGAFYEILRHKAFWFIAPLLGNSVGLHGIPDVSGILGHRPEILTYHVRLVIGFIVLSAFAAFVLCWVNASSLKTHDDPAGSGVSNTMLVYLLGPFTAAYILLLVTREWVYDRYLLPLLMVGVILLLRFYQRKLGDRLPLVCVVLIAAFASFAVAGMHDNFVLGRARIAAVEELRLAGVPRSDVRAGFEYDAWTELELIGYINNEKLVIPAGSYKPQPPSTLPFDCRFWFFEHTPAVQAHYGLAYEPMPCFALSQFPPVSYSTWFPPHQHQILIENIGSQR